MKRYFSTIPSLLILLTLSVVSFPAVGQMIQDPQADRILRGMQEFIGDDPRLSAKFEMEITIPGRQTVLYSGFLDQDGDKFFLDAGDYRIISDGETRWVYIPDSKEVNIYSAKEDDTPTTPLDYLFIYTKEEFTYRLASEYSTEASEAIEFLPSESYSDYAKIRLYVDKNDFRPNEIELFEKGGIRTNLTINEIETVESFDASHFTFDPESIDDVIVEDLRID